MNIVITGVGNFTDSTPDYLNTDYYSLDPKGKLIREQFTRESNLLSKMAEANGKLFYSNQEYSPYDGVILAKELIFFYEFKFRDGYSWADIESRGGKIMYEACKIDTIRNLTQLDPYYRFLFITQFSCGTVAITQYKPELELNITKMKSYKDITKTSMKNTDKLMLAPDKITTKYCEVEALV